MKNKKVLVCLLTAAMTLGLTACGGESKSQSKKEKNEGYDQVTYAYATSIIFRRRKILILLKKQSMRLQERRFIQR